jgi:hypothetical protein
MDSMAIFWTDFFYCFDGSTHTRCMGCLVDSAWKINCGSINFNYLELSILFVGEVFKFQKVGKICNFYTFYFTYLNCSSIHLTGLSRFFMTGRNGSKAPILYDGYGAMQFLTCTKVGYKA